VHSAVQHQIVQEMEFVTITETVHVLRNTLELPAICATQAIMDIPIAHSVLHQLIALVTEYVIILENVYAIQAQLVHHAILVHMDTMEIIVNHVLEELRIHVVDMELVTKE